MSAFTPAMETALSADFPLVCGLLKIELPEHTIRLCDGAGVVTFGGDTYVGRDPVFGTLAEVEPIGDGVGDEAPGLSFTLHPPRDTAAATLAGAAMQGSPVNLWLAAVNRATGAVIPDPLPIFSGELDQPVITVDKGSRELEYECVSGFERLFDNDEGIRLSDSWHRSIWPGEQGLANVSGIIKKVYWGVSSPPASVTYPFNGFFGNVFGDFVNGLADR